MADWSASACFPRSDSVTAPSTHLGRPAFAASSIWSWHSFLISAWASSSASIRSSSETSLRARLDHRDRLGRAADDEVERGLLQVGQGRIDRERTVDATDADRAHRAEERHRREHERRRRAVDGQDVVRVHLVGRERGHDDLDLVLVALRPERPDRPVDHPRGQDRLLAGAAFALEEAAGDLAGRVHLLLDVDGEREEVRPLAPFGAADGGRENDRALLPHQYCTVGLLGDGSGLERDLLVADRGGEAGGLGLYCNAHFPVSLPRPAYRRRPSSLMSAR